MKNWEFSSAKRNGSCLLSPRTATLLPQSQIFQQQDAVAAEADRKTLPANSRPSCVEQLSVATWAFRFPSPCCHTSTWTQRCLQQLRPPHCPAALFSGELQRRDGVPQMGRNEKGVSSRDSGRLITPKGRQTVSLEQRKGRDKYTPSKKTLLFFKICLI